MKRKALAAGAENVLFGVAETPMTEASAASASRALDDGLPPPTQSQVEYWRQLCGALTLAKARGLMAGEWSPELEPTRPTLRALVERGLIVRRKRAWHLKRDWYTRLCSLRQYAVPTLRETLAARPRPDFPSFVELEGIEGICRWLDAQPRRRARLPFAGLVEAGVGVRSETPTPLLHLMHKHRLVRHTSVCEWALSPSWKDRILALWRGADREVREVQPPKPKDAEPFVVAAGIDTWYLNRIDLAGLPLSLRHELDELQQKAVEDEEEIDTPWVYDGTPLRMYRAGVSAEQGHGVSWSYVLRNNSLALLVRRAPLGGIVAQARLGSECLWRLTPLHALNEVDALVKRMWFRPLPFKRRDGKVDSSARWQVSQIHLAVDVANAPLEMEQADRFVSRSRSQAIYQAAKSEVEQLLRTLQGDEDDYDESDTVTMDWGALYDDEYDGFDPFDELVPVSVRDIEPVPAEQRAVTIYRAGKRVSGMTFSAGGDVSMVMYDKVLQGRLKGKRHMEPIWQAAGWNLGMPVTRNEARLRRKAIRELGFVGDARSCLDDPWECLTHLGAIFGAVVGRAEECPDAVDVAWIRRVVPQDDDINRSRWPTDPTWKVVQSATFADAPAEARRLIRRKVRGGDVKILDGVNLGCLVSRVADQHPNGGNWTLSRAVGEAFPAWEALERKKAAAGKDFGELVRERRRQRGLPLPVADKILPFRPDTRRSVASVEVGEERIAQAWNALQVAEQAGRSRRVLRELEDAYLAEINAYQQPPHASHLG